MIIDCHNHVGTDLLFYLHGDCPYAQHLVTMHDHLDQPLAGYTATITQSGTQQMIEWSKAPPAGNRIALRMNFPVNSSARVYAIYRND